MSHLKNFNLEKNNYTPVVYPTIPEKEYCVAIINKDDGLAFRLSTVSFTPEYITPFDNAPYWTDAEAEALEWVAKVEKRGEVDLTIWEPILEYRQH